MIHLWRRACAVGGLMGACFLFMASGALAAPPPVFTQVSGSPFHNLTAVLGVAFSPSGGQRAAAKALHTGPVMHVGLNDWYMAANGSTTAVVKERGGTVREIGIASVSLTRTHKAQLTFIRSFHL